MLLFKYISVSLCLLSFSQSCMTFDNLVLLLYSYFIVNFSIVLHMNASNTSNTIENICKGFID